MRSLEASLSRGARDAYDHVDTPVAILKCSLLIVMCRRDTQAFELFIALSLDFALLRGDASPYDAKQVRGEASEHLLLR
jgi:hypothetical protein